MIAPAIAHTPQRTARWLLLASAVVLLVATPISAQEEEADAARRWYKVELLVFANEQPAALHQEAWEPLPRLRYPSEQRFLVDAAAVLDNAAFYDADVEVDPYGRQLLRVRPPAQPDIDESGNDTAPPAPVIEETAEPPAGGNALQPGAADDPGSETETETPAPEEAPLPTPFRLLDNDQLELNTAAMTRGGRYSMLLHQAWLQPMAEEAGTLPIVLDRSGDLQTWPRLQGSIKLYVSRYLHLETALWLNTTGDYLPATWSMPPPPLGPVSVVVEYPAEPVLPELDGPMQEVATEPAEEVVPIRVPDPLGEDAPLAADEANDATGEQEADAEPLYPWRHAVSLQQKRRMRSSETHYIDHPLLGVVIRVTPLDEPGLQAYAETEIPIDGALSESAEVEKGDQ
jgi:hypothetical protein